MTYGNNTLVTTVLCISLSERLTVRPRMRVTKSLSPETNGRCFNQRPCHCYGNICLGGGGPTEGNVFVDGQPVCNHCWDGINRGDGYETCMKKMSNNNANVVCRNIGLGVGEVAAVGR